MSAAICTLLAFTALTLGLAFVYVGYRTLITVTGKSPANSWSRSGPTWEDPAWVTRFHHAHLNCLENLPVYAAIVLAASLLGNIEMLEGLACWYLIARVVQSAIHVISTSALFVFLRANALIAQWAILIYWLLALAGCI